MFVKLSFPEWVVSGWFGDEQKEAIVRSIILEVISLFGTKRCMFASNFPVDKLANVKTIANLYGDYIHPPAQNLFVLEYLLLFNQGNFVNGAILSLATK